MSSRILSIQSHVVHGYVGNKSATFPLQLLGFDVDCINSVQLSNHTGYEVFKGQILNENDLNDLIDGLCKNDLHVGYSHLLTGYVRNESFLLAVLNVVADLKRSNPGLIYVCDPVMGDDGIVYIPKELIPVFRDKVVPLADIITPNQTELEILSGAKADTLEKALKCVQILHDKGCKTVVITSMEFESVVDQLFIVASHVSPQNVKNQVMIQIPKLKAKFFGTGDLFAATFLAWMAKTGSNLKAALENTVATVTAVITRTLNEYKGCSGDNNGERRGLELKLIQSKDEIENPKVIYRCTEIKA